MQVFQRTPHRNDVKGLVRQFRMRQRTFEDRQSEVAAQMADGSPGKVQARHLPAGVAHLQEEGAIATAEIQQPSLTKPRNQLAIAPKSTQPAPSPLDLAGRLKRRIGVAVELVNALLAGARIGVAQAAILALDDGKVQAASAG